MDLIKIIKNVDVYAPGHIGIKDILIAGGRIAAVEDHISPPVSLPSLAVLEGGGRIVTPGFVDGHVHIAGGGGEGGFGTRTPEIEFSQAVTAGVTSLVGIRGTDGFARNMETLVAKARGLKSEGLSCWILTGSYQVPVRTLTGAIESDIMMVDEVIGVGEIALADHRSSQPTFDEIAKIGAAARLGGMLSGKAGVVNVHMGDGPTGLDLINRVVAETEIPANQFLPTHVNRNQRLLDEAMAYALDGGVVDFTTSRPENGDSDPAVRAGDALKACLDQGIPAEQITFTSDGQGSLPVFDSNGQFKGLTVGTCASLFNEVRYAVDQGGVLLESALQVITSTPSRIYKLQCKGRIAPGYDADIVLLNPNSLVVETVLAQGRVMVLNGRMLSDNTFLP